MKRIFLPLIMLLLFCVPAAAQDPLLPIRRQVGAPAVCPVGRFIQDTATGIIYANVLGSCSVVGGSVTGSGAANHVTFWSSASALSSNSGFTYVAPAVSVSGATTTGPDFEVSVTGDTNARVAVGTNTTDIPRLSMGPGNAVRDTFLERAGAANWRFGAPDAASPVAQTLSVQNVVAGTSNTAGAAFTFSGSRGTGTGVGGSLIFRVAPAGSTGSSQNALADALTIDSTKAATFTGVLKGPDGTVGAPTFSFSGDTNTGIYHGATADDLYIAAGGANAVRIIPNTFRLNGAYNFSWATGDPNSTAGDVFLERDAANTLALRNSTNAQTFRLYNTYTDASNYERATFNWTSNVLHIGAQNAGTGTARVLQLDYGGTTTAAISIPITSGAISFGGSLSTSAGFIAADTSGYFWNSRGRITAAADGVFTLLNNGAGDFSRLQFGGTTASFPALKRSGVTLQLRLADDSAYTQIISAGTATNDNATAGNIGEHASSLIASGSAVSLTTATPANVTSVSLTAGDWDVRGNCNFDDSAATVTSTIGGISSTSATLPTDGSEVYSGVQLVTATTKDSVTLPTKRFSLSGTTTVYLVCQQTFSFGAAAGFGSISARRVR